MKNQMSALFASALVGLALAAPVFAQAPDPGGPPPGQPQQFPGFGGGGFGGQRRPVAFGTVSSVDADAGTITLTPQNGGAGQVVKVGPDAQITTQQTVSVSDLKVGDQITVQGVPTGITASLITAGQPPAGLPGAGGGNGGPRGGNGGGNPGGGGANPAQGFASATGTIKSLPTTKDPHLSITMGTDIQVFLKVADGAKITKYATVALSGIKVGDQILARGTTGDDGTLTASTVGVNLTTGGFGGGGFGGGRFGGGGFGQGGFGGGRGGRRGGQNNGGGFGGPGGGNGGFGGPPPPGQVGATPPPDGQ